MLTYARELHPPARTRRQSSTPPCSSLNPADLRRQLPRWTKASRLIQLRRGVYTLAPPYQKIKPHPFRECSNQGDINSDSPRRYLG